MVLSFHGWLDVGDGIAQSQIKNRGEETEKSEYEIRPKGYNTKTSRYPSMKSISRDSVMMKILYHNF